jgi:hypothetical protein
MAVGLADANDRLDFSSGLGAGLTSLTIFQVVTPRVAPSTDMRMFHDWSGAFLTHTQDSDEFSMAVLDTGGTGAVAWKTSGLNLTNGTTYRIVAKVQSPTTATAFVNGTQYTMTNWLGASGFAAIQAGGSMRVGTDGGADGMTADFGEIAAWSEYLPDHICMSLSLGFSPKFFRRSSSLLYAPLYNLSHMNDEWGGRTITATSASSSNHTSAAHPIMYYPTHGFSSYPGDAAAATFLAAWAQGSNVLITPGIH